ncbi:YwdI family protein [Bacillus sp. REN3]|uniref:YwdI family protein n=1 Tax=Bacillus sp. REN3 TaxID=2802440 RepID=UPI001AED26AD|nr:YwdI family protein [Bacillus sp. REN3]
MEISLQKLLLKMEEEIRLAKGAETESAKRERIHAIKTLCELVLDEPAGQGAEKQGSNQSARMQVPYSPAQPAYQQVTPQAAPLMPQPKKLKMDDEANGDSIFDF